MLINSTTYQNNKNKRVEWHTFPDNKFYNAY